MIHKDNPVLESTPGVIAQSGAGGSVTGTTAETTLATAVIPAGALLKHGRIRFWATSNCTNNANAKTLKVKINGNVVGGALAFASSATQNVEADVVNGHAPNQNYGSIVGLIGSAISQQGAALNVDLSQAITVTVTGQLAVGTDTLTLQAYSLEVFNV